MYKSKESSAALNFLIDTLTQRKDQVCAIALLVASDIGLEGVSVKGIIS